MQINRFKTSFAERIFKQKYAQGPNDSWDALAERLVEDVCGTRWGTERALMSDSDRQQLIQYVKEMKLFRKRKKSELFKERTTSGSAQSGNTTIL